MIKKVFKVTVILLMFLGVLFSVLNFLSIKEDAATFWQKLEMGDDPYGGTYVKCYSSGQACVSVIYYED